MKHSPAPWRIGNKQERAVLDATGSQIAVLPESLKADAALIASSPDLLEACKGALASSTSEQWDEVLIQLKSAKA